MPRRKQARALRDTVLDFLSQHLELCSCGRGVAASLQDSSQPDLSCLPITCLPSTLLTDLLERLALHHLGQLPSDQLQLPLLALELLLQPHTVHFRLLPALPAIPATSILVSRCHRLSSLDISFCTSLDSPNLSSILSHFPLLAHLDLSGTQADDLTLASLSLHCPCLASLSLRHTIVSEHGLVFLSRKNANTGLPACPALVHLNLLHTSVIPYAVYEFIINHRFVREVEYESFEEVLRCFIVMNEALGEWDESNLRRLNFVKCHAELLNTLQHCPEIFSGLESVSILQSDLTKLCLDSLQYLGNLSSLELGNSPFTQYTVYFHEHVVPVLDHLGNKLTQLSLEKFKFVDVEAIGESCPKLQNLRLSKILSFCNTSHSPKFPLLNLETLTVLNTKSCRITEKTLRLLLASRRLTSVNLHSVNSFSDQFIFSVLQTGSLSFLQQLILQQCSFVSVRGICLLLNCPGPLASLSCWGCSLLGEQDRRVLDQRLQEENLELSLDWRARGLMDVEEMEDFPDLEEDREDLLALLIM